MGQVTGYKITVRSLERQLVGEDVLKELASLEDCQSFEERAIAPTLRSGKLVLVLEEDERAPHAGLQRPQK